MIKKAFKIFFFFSLILVIGGGVYLWFFYQSISKQLPKIEKIEDFTPPAVSQIFSEDNILLGEIYEVKRYPVFINEVPKFVRNAFLAAEDANFYQHPGIDFMGILRAMIKNIKSGKIKQGGSTITQQVVKNLLLTSDKTIIRKIKEAILAYRLENYFTKDEILQIYLNQIFLGNSAYGIKAAAKIYFHKNLDELTLAEAALLAGLPKAPSKYSPVLHFNRAKARQIYVLKQMVKNGFITEEEADRARQEEMKIYKATNKTLLEDPYFTVEVKRQIRQYLTEEQLRIGGYKIYTTDLHWASKLAEKSLRDGIERVQNRQGYFGPINKGVAFKNYIDLYGEYFNASLDFNSLYPALVKRIEGDKVIVQLGDKEAFFNLNEAKWAKKRRDSKQSYKWVPLKKIVAPGDVVLVKVRQLSDVGDRSGGTSVIKVALTQKPSLQGALVLYDALNGEYKVIIGGYDYRENQFNRAVQALRQPGSVFKPIVYLTAIDAFGYTPASIVSDRPRVFRIGNDLWEPKNFDKKYLGDITLQLALERSRNLVSADIISKIGPATVVQYAKRLGITSHLGANLSLSLGSYEVSLYELVRAYGVFPAGGILFDGTLIKEIKDRFGKVVYSYAEDKINKAHEVISAQSAFILTNMMKGVVERGTAWRVRDIKRPVAGKTGTSNNMMDAWFIGFTPQWVCGIWVGYDLKETIGKNETGGKVAAPIWLDFMQKFLKEIEDEEYAKIIEEAKNEAVLLGIEYVKPDKPAPPDFTIPPGVSPVWINRFTGEVTTSDDPEGALEYFAEGWQPNNTENIQGQGEEYFFNSEL